MFRNRFFVWGWRVYWMLTVALIFNAALNNNKPLWMIAILVPLALILWLMPNIAARMKNFTLVTPTRNRLVSTLVVAPFGIVGIYWVMAAILELQPIFAAPVAVIMTSAMILVSWQLDRMP